MSTAYRVKRPEPLAVNDIKVVLQGTLNDLGTLTDVEGDDSWDEEDQHDDMDREDQEDDEGYVKSIHAIITGKTRSGERETIGHIKADLLQVHRAVQNRESLWAICDERSESLAMLFRACFTKQAIDQGILPDEYVFGDVLMIESVRLKPQYRGYGIGLLAVDELMKHVGRASSRWSDEGLIVLDPSGLTSDLAQGHSHEEVQEKLIRYWQMLGLWVLVRERKRHCTFVGHWMGDQRPDIAAIVPHLFE